MTFASTSTFTFGIYPGGLLGTDAEILEPVRPDQPEQITGALRLLQGDAPTLAVRAYRPYESAAVLDSPATPVDPGRYRGEGRVLDLALTFREPDGQLDGWVDFVRHVVRTEGPHLAALQICEEPNAYLPILDGSTPNVREAVVRGVIAAKEEALACGFDIAIGFNAVPNFDPADTFWPELGALMDDRFHRSLDYVGLDFFPDVFRPLPPEQLAAAVAGVLSSFRDTLGQVGIGSSVPVRICENGWPTGPDRSEQRQAEVLEEVVRTLYGLREELNLTGYCYFDLRDADSSGTGLFDRFGLLRDDYTPKAAFDTYRRLISELSVSG
ncbi:hypothetical protein [Saccharothrix sp. ST-888]|uniref:hypothetical protein n=1 Tax=Saccharothrix sp. ST-888 TaxID=1427391 RepID=UPI0005EC9EFE|nr:hypothetical protein [Saccharothrix sp. ST-888]KJK57519.1 hypothetical protein UK12_16260 [Saccharothrix sp. ST-888]